MKVHNSKTARKVSLRQKIVGGMGALKVLELYAGPGEMRHQAWVDANKVTGIDADMRSVAEYQGDTCRTLRHIDFTEYNVFDADAFGVPWEPVWLISRKSGALPDDIAVFITAGGAVTSMAGTFRKAGWSRQMCDALCVRPGDPIKGLYGKKASANTAARMVAAFFADREITKAASAVGGASGGTLYAGFRLSKR